MPPVIAYRNRGPQVVFDNRLLFEYLNDLGPALEYLCNDASGGIVNSGSAGATYDMTEAGNPTYQAGQGDAFGYLATEDYYIDLDGVEDGFYSDVVTALLAMTEGAVVILYRIDTNQFQTLFSLKQEADNSSSLIQIALDASGFPTLQILDASPSPDHRTFSAGNASWGPNADTAVNHMFVVQKAAEGITAYLDGHRVDNAAFMTLQQTVGAGNDLWFADLADAEVFSIGGRVQFDGAGSFVEMQNDVDGRVEYCGIFGTPFSREEIDEMFTRFIGGAPVGGIAVTAGLESVAQIVSTTFAAVAPFYSWLEKHHNVIINLEDQLYASNPEFAAGSAFDSIINDLSMSKNGLFSHEQDQNLVSVGQGSAYRSFGAYRPAGLAGTGSAEAYFGAFWNPYTGQNNGRDQIVTKSIATAFAQTSLCWYWDYLAGTAGEFALRAANWLDVQPIRFVPGSNRRSYRWSAPAGAYMCQLTLSGAGDNLALGGGAPHIYSMSGAGNTYAGVQQTIVGYVPSTNYYQCADFFNDGVTDYLIAGAVNAGGITGVTGELDAISIYVRSGATWTATANLLNGGVSSIPAGADRVLWVEVIDDDLYIGFQGSPAPAAFLAVNHYRWNGTTFALVGAVPWPPASDTATNNSRTIGASFVTEDKLGVVFATVGEPSNTVPTLLAYDRDLLTGALTYRANFFDSLSTAVKNRIFGQLGATDLNFSEMPDGVDGQ